MIKVSKIINELNIPNKWKDGLIKFNVIIGGKNNVNVEPLEIFAITKQIESISDMVKQSFCTYANDQFNDEIINLSGKEKALIKEEWGAKFVPFNNVKYEYSEEVQKLEEKIKQMKEEERKKGIAKIIVNQNGQMFRVSLL